MAERYIDPEPEKERGKYGVKIRMSAATGKASPERRKDEPAMDALSSGERPSRRQRKNRTRMLREQRQHQMSREKHILESSSSSSSVSGSSESNFSPKALEGEEMMPVEKDRPCYESCLLRQHGFPENDDLLEDTLSYLIQPKDMLIRNGYPVAYDPSKTYCQHYREVDLLGAHGVALELGKVYYRGWMPRGNAAGMEEAAPSKGGSLESSDQESSSDSEQDFLESAHLSRKCSRCSSSYSVRSSDLECVVEEDCRYHPEIGSFHNHRACACCGRSTWTVGCTVAKSHVWSGSRPGLNGPFVDYVRTKRAKSEGQRRGVYALDCEMCFTKEGLELARVTLVDLHGRVVYDHVVKPKNDIIDFNTRFSGMTEHDFKSCTKTLAEVQEELLDFIHQDTIIVGHGLENDFKILKLLHYNVIDTSLLGTPGHRASLKALANAYLHRNIQTGSHDSAEDAAVAMELVLTFVSFNMSIFHNYPIDFFAQYYPSVVETSYNEAIFISS